MQNLLNKMYLHIKKNKFYIATYMLFFVICTLTPISGDDYANYIKGQQGIVGILNSTKSFYLNWEGRIVSRFLIFIFTPRKFLWNIVTPFLFVLIFRSLLKIDAFKNKNSYLLLLLAILLVNSSMFAQTYTWLAGNITYLYPTALSIYYLTTLYNINNKIHKKHSILLSILAIIIPMFAENIGCAFVFGNFLFIIYNKCLKKDTKINWVLFILSTISLILMLISPGSINRANEEGVINSFSLLERLRINVLYFFTEYTITRHTAMLLLIVICCNIYCFRNKSKLFSKKYKIIFIILFDIVSLLIICNNLLNIKFVVYNIYCFSYWILLSIIFIASLIDTYRGDKKILLFYILLIVTALSSTICMLVLMYWFDRISIVFVIVMSFISIKIIDKNINIDKNKIIIKIFFVISLVYIVFCMFCAYRIEKYRTNYVIKQKELKQNVIEVIYNPSQYLWLSNLNSQYFVDTYKEYQEIEKENKLVLKKLSLREYMQIIFCNEK